MNTPLHPEPATSSIDGAFVVPPPCGRRLDIINTSTEAVLAQLCEADADEVDCAVAAASTAFEQARWRGLPVKQQRAAVMRRMAELTEQHSKELCHLESPDLRMPFGGYNESGIGHEGIEGMRALYAEEKSVATALRPFKPAVRFGAAEAAA